MDVTEVNHSDEYMEDASKEQLLSAEASDTYDVFGDPEVLPRVGDQYQAEVPSLITKSESLWLTKWLNDATRLDGALHNFLMGLPITIMWIEEAVEDIKPEHLETVGGLTDASSEKEPVKFEGILEIQRFSEGDDRKPKDDLIDIALDVGIQLGESTSLALQQEKIETHHEARGKRCRPVPGSLGDTWSDIEEASFLLGLYMFGKNLVMVKKFVESKSMGDILSLYYGKFYKSAEYRRWSERRKMRSKRCVYGQRIFIGMRQQEFLSRLLCNVSEESKSTVLEVSKTFGEGKMSLEEYIFTLKATFGLNALVKAVGIGKGKEDLTGMVMEPLKSNQVPVRPEVPVGKACSSLTPLEIINFLTGGYRLSKARSNDLFWEAVWPRLLARGWHSEQPNNHGCAVGSRHSLVFLLPGIKKFSRRKLVKGDHYFDSVSDVLSKVASDPGLLELETGTDGETKVDQEDFPDQQRHCYLKPRTPNRCVDVKKFTIVDTSLPRGGTFKVRELRSLPVEVMHSSTSRNHSDQSGMDTSEESTDESKSDDTSCFDKDGTDISKSTKINSDWEVSFDGKDLGNYVSNGNISINDLDSTNVNAKIHKDQFTNSCNGVPPRKAILGLPSQRKNPGIEIHLAPVTKRRRRLTACNRPGTSQRTHNMLVGPRLRQEAASCCPCNPDLGETILSGIDQSQEKLTCTSSSSKGSPIISGEGILSSSFSSAEDAQEKPQTRTLIDLNLPITVDAETDEPCRMEMTERQHDEERGEPGNPSALQTTTSVAGSQQMNSRRQSTRNRPLTTKALEALAFGFLTTKQKRKSRNAFPGENSLSRPSHRARGEVRAAENFGDGMINFNAEERENGICESNGEVLSKLQVKFKGEEGVQVLTPKCG
ncbi:hypothetical protein CFOL_v3_29277 [Cephalotus follicularis]|uniref:SANT domain-containing protein n=1 Tax=Cephalotus follicularis TaxID=3775 RepID=A0A1Q3D0M3_CEPFO|nr:hypothetical protein CFOL_v3_29277 [Cephalotus follicularis]